MSVSKAIRERAFTSEAKHAAASQALLAIVPLIVAPVCQVAQLKTREMNSSLALKQTTGIAIHCRLEHADVNEDRGETKENTKLPG